MNPRVLFVTGTDTGVGKTRVAAALCRAIAVRGMRVAAMKPVASGCTLTADGCETTMRRAARGGERARRLFRGESLRFRARDRAAHSRPGGGVDIDFSVLDRAYERLRMRADILVVEAPAAGWRPSTRSAVSRILPCIGRWTSSWSSVCAGMSESRASDRRVHRARGLRLRGWWRTRSIRPSSGCRKTSRASRRGFLHPVSAFFPSIRRPPLILWFAPRPRCTDRLS